MFENLSLAELLKNNSAVLSLQPNNRIKCSATGHEMPPTADAVRLHLAGKKYKKACEWYNRDYSQYLPWIIEHRSDKTKLFCTVTRMTLNKIPAEIEKHVAGKRFLRMQKALEERKKGLDAKAAKKLARQKEREEAERLGIWIPGADILGDDASDDEDEEGDMHDNDDMDEQESGGDAMDEDNADEDWIITSDKLRVMKRNGISEEHHPRVLALGTAKDDKSRSKNKTHQAKKGSVANNEAPPGSAEKAAKSSTGKRLVKQKEAASQAPEAKPSKKHRV